MFLSDRAETGENGIYVLDLGGGEARRLAETEGKITQAEWSPDGRRIAFVMTDPKTGEEKRREEEHDDRRVAEEALKFDRLWIAEITTGATRQVTSGDHHVWEFHWSPEGSRLVLAVADRPGDDGWYTAQLAVVPADAGDLVRFGSPGKQLALPRWSPDGRQLAFLACTWSDAGVIGGDLFVADAVGSNGNLLTAGEFRSGVRKLTGREPLSITWAVWTPSGDALHVLAHEDGKLTLGAITLDGSITRYWSESIACAERVQPRFSRDLSATRFAVAREDGSKPRDIWTYDLAAPAPTPDRSDREEAAWSCLTDLHRDFRQIHLGPVSEVRWSAPDGQLIQGLVVHPPVGEPPFPLVVQVHGGPAGVWSCRCPVGWHDWGHVLAAQGFLVLLPNPRGSFGGGTAFTEANLGDMGGRDWKDILSGVDHLIDEGLADPARMGIGGWSYGGFMTAWAVSQTDRFRAAVMGAGISNWVSFHGTSEIPEWDRTFWQADPYESDGLYRRFSPITHVANVKTPTLILHGEEDRIVPVCQAREFYRALKDHGVETKLVTYPRQGHPIQEKKHQRDLLDRVVEWYRQYLMD